MYIFIGMCCIKLYVELYNINCICAITISRYSSFYDKQCYSTGMQQNIMQTLLGKITWKKKNKIPGRCTSRLLIYSVSYVLSLCTHPIPMTNFTHIFFTFFSTPDSSTTTTALPPSENNPFYLVFIFTPQTIIYNTTITHRTLSLYRTLYTHCIYWSVCVCVVVHIGAPKWLPH